MERGRGGGGTRRMGKGRADGGSKTSFLKKEDKNHLHLRDLKVTGGEETGQRQS